VSPGISRGHLSQGFSPGCVFHFFTKSISELFYKQKNLLNVLIQGADKDFKGNKMVWLFEMSNKVRYYPAST
jgi:hypothetical protein